MAHALAATTLARTMPPCEIEVFVVSASRGDVIPACMRLAQARSDAAWGDRFNMALAIGPACPATVLDLACSYMPRATEPRLLRAAASMRLAAMARDDDERELWSDAARRDLLDALRCDPHDGTARAILFDFLGLDQGAVASAFTSDAESARP